MSYAPYLFGTQGDPVPEKSDAWQWNAQPFRLTVEPSERVPGTTEIGAKWTLAIGEAVETGGATSQDEAIEILEMRLERMLEALNKLAGLDGAKEKAR